MHTAASAVIAEDEPLLASALKAELARAWPELVVAAVVGDGASAVRAALELRPEVLFFDIRMPGMGGLEAAAELAEQWPARAGDAPFPALVFVTAYDQYAVQAFEAQAIDYLLKPVQAPRLHKTVAKLQQSLAARVRPAVLPGSPGLAADAALEQTLAQLRQLLGARAAPGSGDALKFVQASVGGAIHLVPVAEVLYFEAADKYVRVLTAGREYLIRTPLRELLPQLDPRQFWQIHRGTVVRADAVLTVTRDEAGKSWLQLHGRPEKLAVSRIYAPLFKAM